MQRNLRNLLAAIVESSTDAIISKTLDGIITSWNNGAERIFGYKAEEVIGKAVYILIPQDFRDEEPTILDLLKKGHRVEHYETVRQRKDGKLINVSLSVSPVKDTIGSIIGAAKIARDITKSKELEEALHIQRLIAEKHQNKLLEQQQEANRVKDEIIEELKKAQLELVRLASIVESSHDPIISQDLDGVMIDCNKSTERLYGYSAEEIRGRHISMLFPDGYTDAIPKLLMPVHRGESISDFETVNITKTGSILQVSLTAFPVKDKFGEVINASIIVRDLTERKYIERERAKLLNREM